MKKKCKSYRKERRQLLHYVVKHTTYTSFDVRKFSNYRLVYVANQIFDWLCFQREFFGLQSGSDFVTPTPCVTRSQR